MAERSLVERGSRRSRPAVPSARPPGLTPAPALTLSNMPDYILLEVFGQCWHRVPEFLGLASVCRRWRGLLASRSGDKLLNAIVVSCVAEARWVPRAWCTLSKLWRACGFGGLQQAGSPVCARVLCVCLGFRCGGAFWACLTNPTEFLSSCTRLAVSWPPHPPPPSRHIVHAPCMLSIVLSSSWCFLSHPHALWGCRGCFLKHAHQAIIATRLPKVPHARPFTLARPHSCPLFPNPTPAPVCLPAPHH
jgi:hypothetical protein